MPQEKEVQVLIRLGLTCNQARVYLTLFRSGMSSARTISETSKVAREDIYRIIPKLQELSLVEKIIDSPSMYKAIPIKDALTILMNSRKQETSKLEAEINDIIQNSEINKIRRVFEKETQEFILIPKEQAVIKRKKMIDNAQKRVDLITAWERFNESVVSYDTNIENALKKNVELRIIIGKPKNEKLLLELTKVWREKYVSFKTRWIPNYPSARVTLVDAKEVLFAKSVTTGFEDPFLWSINQSLVAVVQDFFETMWTASFEPKTTSVT
jgi:sugar-specific transcriptional regulator TrmB